jgi:hypothetical protein
MMEIIKETMMKWGEAMQLSMENRSLFYSPVLDHWRVKKWGGKRSKTFLYDGADFRQAFEHLLGPHATKHPLDPADGNDSH